ncbi:MAG: alpha/beta hydrolase [Bacteroidota bacterium]|nr:alpha/beta hydrolase [Bacteroidota bacterium]MDP4273852.1 alpha/beta hydrolase [Bacteroidota bacterium]
MINLKVRLFCLILLICGLRASAQEFIPLWPSGKMINSKGLNLKDSIVNERYFRVGVPGIYTYFADPEKNKGAAVIICPGGGYHHYAYVSSGTDVAKWFNSLGINAFVLISRLPISPDLIDRSKVPLQDAQRAIRLIRANSNNWNIKTDKIGVIGFSAGGHVASSLGTHTEDISAIGDSLDKQPFCPDFMLLVSPVISMGKYAHLGSRDNLLGKNLSPELIEQYSSELQVTPKTPPAFIVHADNDKTVNPQNSILFYQALREKKIPASLHIFPQGGHSIGMGENPGSTDLWTKLCEMWLKEMGIIN